MCNRESGPLWGGAVHEVVLFHSGSQLYHHPVAEEVGLNVPLGKVSDFWSPQAQLQKL